MNLKELNELNAAENEVTHEIELKHPVSEDGLGVFLTLISPQSEKPKKLAEKFANKLRMNEAKEAKTGKPLTTIEDYEKQGIAFQAACVTDWRGLEEDGEAVEFSQSALREHILDNPVFRAQIQAELESIENFIKA